jgi:hypothetical protein
MRTPSALLKAGPAAERVVVGAGHARHRTTIVSLATPVLHTDSEQEKHDVDHRIRSSAIVAALLLASCGRPDASGVYLSRSDRQAALIQLTQAKDGALTGRVEVFAIGPGGAVDIQSEALDGAVANRDVTFRPARAWLGGAAASGSFTGDALTIRRNGAEVTARKASRDDFQKAVAQLKAKAAEERHQAAEAQSNQAARTAQASSFEDAADKAAKLQAATAGLRADAARLNDAVTAAPDFGRQSADNTARLARMAQSLPTLSKADRARLAVSANQVIVETNQIDAARARYAGDLNRIVAQAAPVATAVERFCDTPQAAAFGQACAQGKAAATAFESALVRGATVFKGYKQTIQTELAQQGQIAKRVGG